MATTPGGSGGVLRPGTGSDERDPARYLQRGRGAPPGGGGGCGGRPGYSATQLQGREATHAPPGWLPGGQSGPHLHHVQHVT